MSKEITILRGSSGINNIVDPARLRFSQESGLSELKAAINVEIDETGRISRRKGTTLLTSLTDAHSLFSHKNDCFVAAQGNLYRVHADYSLLGLRAGMNYAAKLSYAAAGDKIFYANGYEHGVIALHGLSYPWTKSEYSGPVNTRMFYNPPIGHLLMVAQGRMHIADGSLIWYSEPFAYSLFRKAKDFYQFDSRITMMIPVDGGFYVGDQQGVYFIDLEQNRRHINDCKALQGSERTLPKGAFPRLELGEGRVAIWLSSDGVWIGASNGVAVNVTQDQLLIPSGVTEGAIVLQDNGFVVATMF